MVDKKTNPLIIIGIVILAFYLISNTSFFGITLFSSQVQYLNVPISVNFKVINMTAPTIQAFYNDIELFEVQINESTNETIQTGQTISYKKDFINQTYILTITNVSQTGIFKFVATEGNQSDTQVIEVRNPFVDIKYNIPTSLNKGESYKLQVQTFTPQGAVLEADSVDIDVYDPDNVKTTIFLDKSGNTFTKTFNYEKAGSYQFKIHARKVGFDTKEVTAITNVIKSAGIHPILFIWFGAIIFWVLFFIIRRVRK